MKKIFTILVACALFVACSHNGNKVVEEQSITTAIDTISNIDTVQVFECDTICDTIGVVED